MTLRGHRVLLLAGDPVAFRNIFSGYAHMEPPEGISQRLYHGVDQAAVAHALAPAATG